jgi:hypothetical protein
MNRKIMVASVVLAVGITPIGDATYAAVKKSRAHQYGTRPSDLQRAWPPAMASEQAPAEVWKCRYQGGPKAPMTCSLGR